VARIPDEEVKRLQREVSVERLAEARSVKLHGDGDKLVGTCPFHDGSEHVLVIDPTANTWTCAECEVTNGTSIEWCSVGRVSRRLRASRTSTASSPVLLVLSQHGSRSGGLGRLLG
jgi:hypothetical protein